MPHFAKTLQRLTQIYTSAQTLHNCTILYKRMHISPNFTHTLQYFYNTFQSLTLFIWKYLYKKSRLYTLSQNIHNSTKLYTSLHTLVNTLQILFTTHYISFQNKYKTLQMSTRLSPTNVHHYTQLYSTLQHNVRHNFTQLYTNFTQLYKTIQQFYTTLQNMFFLLHNTVKLAKLYYNNFATL